MTLKNMPSDKQINVLFHVGRGKTATSFLQSHISSIPNCLFVGKDREGFRDTESFLSLELRKAHYKLFPSYRIEFQSHSNPTVCSYFAAKSYAKIIADAWLVNPVGKIIISDECISDYANYLGELNIFLIKLLYDLIIEEIKEPSIKFCPTLVLTIREQGSLLKSFYGYNFTTLKQKFPTFASFTDWVCDNPHKSIQGGSFYYECVKSYRQILNGWKLKIVPYEILKNDADKYFREVFDYDLNILQPERINPNISETGETLAREYLTSGKFIWSMREKVSDKPKIRYIINSLSSTKRFVKGVIRLVDKVPSLKTKENTVLQVEDCDMHRIRSLYSESNRLLNDMVSHDLEEFGYQFSKFKFNEHGK